MEGRRLEIAPLDEEAMRLARERWDRIAKPLNSLAGWKMQSLRSQEYMVCRR